MGFSIASSLLGMAAVMVLTRMLSPTEYGLIGVFLSILYFVAPLVSLSCDGLIAVNKVTLDAENYARFQRTCIGIAYLCFALLQITFLTGLAIGFLSNWLLALIPVFGLVRFLVAMAGIEYVAEERALMFGAMTLLTAIVALVLTVIMTYSFEPWGGFRLLALLVADLLMLAVRYRGRIKTLFKPKLNKDYRKQILAFGLPSLLCLPGAWGLNEADKIIIAKLSDMNTVGLYVAGAALAAIMATFNQSLANGLYPGLFRSLASPEKPIQTVLIQYALGFFGLSIIFCALVIGGYFLLGDFLLPPQYVHAEPVFLALMLTGIAVSIYRPFGLAADYYKLARVRAVAILLGGFLSCVVTYFGVKYDGILWAPVGIGTGYIGTTLILAIGLKWNEVRK